MKIKRRGKVIHDDNELEKLYLEQFSLNKQLAEFAEKTAQLMEHTDFNESIRFKRIAANALKRCCQSIEKSIAKRDGDIGALLRDLTDSSDHDE